MSDKILQGLLTHKAVMLSSGTTVQLAASQGDALVAWVYVPFRFRFFGVAYSLNVGGSTGEVTDVKVYVTTTQACATHAAAAAAGGGVVENLIEASVRYKDYDPTYLKITLDTAANTTIDDQSWIFIVQPIGGK